MKLKFTKMHGIGNDYIYINTFDQSVDDPAAVAKKLSDRRFGVGGDGVILIAPSIYADAWMRMFNEDGSEGKMCGNGIRCVGKYIYDKGIVPKDQTVVSIETLSGVKTLTLFVENGKVKSARVDMDAPVLIPEEIPIAYDGESVINKPLTVGDKEYLITAVSMGNPHCVVFVDDVDSIDIEKTGPLFEHHEVFPDRVNTEFIEILDKNTLKMRVWERGSGETLACGTGACAAVVAACLNGYCERGEDIRVKLRGGDLIIRYDDKTVWMTGPAETVFEGETEI